MRRWRGGTASSSPARRRTSPTAPGIPAASSSTRSGSRPRTARRDSTSQSTSRASTATRARTRTSRSRSCSARAESRGIRTSRGSKGSSIESRSASRRTTTRAITSGRGDPGRRPGRPVVDHRGEGHARIYATTAIPTGLYRVSDRPHSGILTLNFGALERLTWLDSEGRDGFVGLEAGVMAVGPRRRPELHRPAADAGLDGVGHRSERSDSPNRRSPRRPR